MVIVADISDLYSGGGISLFNSLRYLKGRIEFVVLTKRGTLFSALISYGIDVYVVDCRSKYDVFFVKKVLRLLKNMCCDSYVVTHSERTSVLLNPFLYLFGYSVITVIHRSLLMGSPWESRVKGAIHLFAETFVLKYCTNLIVPVSQSMANELIDVRGIHSSKVHVVENCVDVESLLIRSCEKRNNTIFPVFSDTSDYFTILSILRFDFVKGVDFFSSDTFMNFLDELYAIIGMRIRVVLLGDGRLLNTIKSKLSLCEKKYVNFSLPGNVTNVSDYLAYSDLYFQPSRSEAYGLSVVEASLYDVPIIVNKLPVFEEVLYGYKKSIHLSLFDELDVKDLVAQLQKLGLNKNIESIKPSYSGWDWYPHSCEDKARKFISLIDRHSFS